MKKKIKQAIQVLFIFAAIFSLLFLAIPLPPRLPTYAAYPAAGGGNTRCIRRLLTTDAPHFCWKVSAMNAILGVESQKTVPVRDYFCTLTVSLTWMGFTLAALPLGVTSRISV